MLVLFQSFWDFRKKSIKQIFMILIADSGSTKTSWRFISQTHEIHQAKTVGFNPYFEKPTEIAQTIHQTLLPQLSKSVDTIEQVYFYGAGCSQKLQKEVMKIALQTCFSKAICVVEDDMLGAARSLSGTQASIICILGTGSNSCFYDGKILAKNLGGLGLILGDEGSGADFGRALLKAYFNEELPPDLHQKFEQRFQPQKAVVFDHVYSKPYPNRYLATFSKFLFDNKAHAYCSRLVYDCLSTFLEKTVLKYPNHETYKVHFTGGIAFYYSSLLRQVAQDKGIIVGNIAEEPIAGLTLYHLENN
jgi:glucosamine kinase